MSITSATTAVMKPIVTIRVTIPTPTFSLNAAMLVISPLKIDTNMFNKYIFIVFPVYKIVINVPEISYYVLF